MSITTVSGSDVNFKINPKTGVVISFKGCNDFNIKKFDIEEYKHHYKMLKMPEALDILTIGYWWKFKEGQGKYKYQAPEHDYRKEILIKQ